jgi:hypothetical protein
MCQDILLHCAVSWGTGNSEWSNSNHRHKEKELEGVENGRVETETMKDIM